MRSINWFKYLKYLFFVFLAFLSLWGLDKTYRWAFPPEHSVYRIGVDPSWYPISLYGNEPTVTAFSEDLLSSFARNQKLKLEIVRTGPKRVLELLDDGLIDGILTSINPNMLNEDNYYFSEPYYRFGAVIILRKDMTLASLKALPNERIAVPRNSSILFRIPLDPEAIVIPYDSHAAALDDLIHSQVDAVIMDQLLTFLYYGGQYRDKVKIATLPLTQEGLRLVTLRSPFTKKLIEQFNIELNLIKSDGTYEKLLEKWGIHDSESLK